MPVKPVAAEPALRCKFLKSFMNIDQYKNSIKQIIDSTNNELLLIHWEKQLQHDIAYINEITLPVGGVNLQKHV